MNDFFQQLHHSFTWAKLLYTGLLVAVVVLLLTEIKRLWTDRGVFVGNFQFYEDGALSADKGNAFALRLADTHAFLRRQFTTAEQSDFQDEKIWTPKAGSPIERSESVLSELDIKVQEINLTDILARLRKAVSAPNEITGSVSKTSGGLRASFKLVEPVTELANGTMLGRFFPLDGLKSEADAAFKIACSLIWIEAGIEQQEIASVPHEEFCHWTEAWTLYLDYRRQSEGVSGLGDAGAEALLALNEALTRRINQGVVYPKYHSLRADVVEVLPADKRGPFLIQVQNDRLRYAVLLGLDPKKRAGADVAPEVAYAQLAQARPAVPIRNGKLGEMSPAWRRILEPAESSLLRVAKSTGIGFLQRSERQPRWFLCGFAIAPGVIATMAASVPANLQGVELGDEHIAEFGFADSLGSDGRVSNGLPIRRVLYRSRETTGIALLEVEGHNAESHPPVPLATGDSAAVEPGRYVSVIGYPSNADPRVPPEFIEALLGTETEIKRALFGRLVAKGSGGAGLPESVLGLARPLSLVSDVSTTGGTGGGPLVDLHTGRVIGVHSAGRWEGLEQGKFAIAGSMTELLSELPEEIRDMIFPTSPEPQPPSDPDRPNPDQDPAAKH